MSLYLTFYLVPKGNKTKYNKDSEEIIKIPKEPLAVFSYSRNSGVYEEYFTRLSIPYAGTEDKYTELTPEDANSVISKFVDEELKPAKERLERLYKVLKVNYNEDLVEDIFDCEEYIRDLNWTLENLKHIAHFVEEIGYHDFEKVLINYD